MYRYLETCFVSAQCSDITCTFAFLPVGCHLEVHFARTDGGNRMTTRSRALPNATASADPEKRMLKLLLMRGGMIAMARLDSA